MSISPGVILKEFGSSILIDLRGLRLSVQYTCIFELFSYLPSASIL